MTQLKVFRVVLPIFCGSLLMLSPFIAFIFDIAFYKISTKGYYQVVEGAGIHTYAYTPSKTAIIISLLCFISGLGLLFVYAPKLENGKKK